LLEWPKISNPQATRISSFHQANQADHAVERLFVR
jgi:hypothetical protein